MKLTFIGAAHEVTGSCTLLEACGKHILIDCGMEQGGDTYENCELPVAPSQIEAISHSTCGMAIDLDAKAIVACTLSGRTARMVSRFRSPVPIIGLTTDERTWRRLAMSWGVIPAICEKFTSTDVLFYTAKKIAESELPLNKNDKIIITGGVTPGESGNTNLIKIEKI